MTLPFKNLPSNVRVPLFYAEVDNSQANTATLNKRALIIGQITSAGIATPNVPILCQGVAEAASQGGPGSMLHLQTQMYRLNDTFGEVWLLPVADDGSAVAAAGSIAVTAAATTSGVFYLYIAGVRIAVTILSSMTTAQAATAINNAINATPNLPVTSSVSSSTVTITARNKGPHGNDIDIRANYLGTAGGEALPPGFAYTLTAMSGGLTAPTLTTALSNLSDKPFDYIVCPYTDPTSLNALKTLLDDNTGRWSWSRQIYGHFFAAARGTSGTLTTLGTARNDQHGSIAGLNGSPTPPWLISAAFAAQAAVADRADVGRPLHTLVLQGVLAPDMASRFTLSERNTLLYSGISTLSIADDGSVAIEQAITTYQQNSFGQPDDSYLKVETLFLLTAVIRLLRTRVTSKYARMKLANDGTRYAAGSAVVTPSVIRADLIAAYREMEGLAWVQNADAFAQALIVQRNAQNPNRVDVLWPGTLINQLDILALLAQFRLS
ncbi:phage tail sheath subtilisin-like domain-containing protein [uncultured Pseudacidovorax sp.]|uniref:phage tail sheath subtilisin-like domain-containing protein n=1 Tax=uncultured Pseudacidovorax sp. TaxID=679313 RepID=UPI0025D47021|nr:phage tail sheath subtilisin-like domain-containing protein [uncultured Pseudacidovorax sp.]